MEPPAGGSSPTQSDMAMAALSRYLFVLRGLSLRLRILLEGTEKPWPNRTKQARAIASQMEGMLHDAQAWVPQDYTKGASADAVASDHTKRPKPRQHDARYH